MTVSSITPVNNYTGNSSTTIFDFDFLIEKESELVVHYMNSSGIVSRLQYGIDYSISEIGSKSGAYITFPITGSKYNVLGNDEHISLSLDLQIKQESEFHNSSYFNLEILEWTFDYIVRILQILNRKIERCIKVEETADVKPEQIINDLYDTRKEVQSSYSNIVNLSNEVKTNLDITIEKSELATEQLELARKEAENAKYQAEIATQKAKDSVSVPIGTLLPLVCDKYYVPEGYLPCDGAEYYAAQFEELFKHYLGLVEQPLLSTCTYAQYEEELATYGQCSKFAVDYANGTFRVPLIKDGAIIQQALTDSELGKSYNAGLPNIRSSITVNSTATADTQFLADNTEIITSDGALYVENVKSCKGIGQSSSTTSMAPADLSFDASRSNAIYGNSDTVQMNAVALRYFVVVANGQTNQSMMDWSAWASSLQAKMNADHSNDTKPYIVETSDKSILPSWYRVWSDGWCEQGGIATGGTNITGNTITLLKVFINNQYNLLASVGKADITTLTNSKSLGVACFNKTTSSFNASTMYGDGTFEAYTFSWQAKGYIK